MVLRATGCCAVWWPCWVGPADVCSASVSTSQSFRVKLALVGEGTVLPVLPPKHTGSFLGMRMEVTGREFFPPLFLGLKQ